MITGLISVFILPWQIYNKKSFPAKKEGTGGCFVLSASFEKEIGLTTYHQQLKKISYIRHNNNSYPQRIICKKIVPKRLTVGGWVYITCTVIIFFWEGLGRVSVVNGVNGIFPVNKYALTINKLYISYIYIFIES